MKVDELCSMRSLKKRLVICKETRKIASKTLFAAFKNLRQTDKPISEVILRDEWLKQLRKQKEIFPQGWYIPPPHGIGVLIGTADENSRQNYKSLRPKEIWPKNNIFLNSTNNIMYVFASPVDRKFGIIGDFGITLYFGDDEKIKSHLRLCLKINDEIFNFAAVDRKFSEVSIFADTVFERYKVKNQVTSTTDIKGTNIGHTIPGTYNEWKTEEINILKHADEQWEKMKNIINFKRVFLNNTEDTVIQPGMAMTFEPRLTSVGHSDIPMSSFHTIMVFRENGEKELITQFDEIFRYCGMDYMI